MEHRGWTRGHPSGFIRLKVLLTLLVLRPKAPGVAN